MNRTIISLLIVFFGYLMTGFLESSYIYAQGQTNANIKENKSILARIEQITNAKGEFIEKEGVYKVGFPRSDLKVNISGVRMNPAMGLTVWAGFKITGNNTMVMGDTVLAEDQVNPVMDAALENGLEVTAIHNHFLWDSPKVMFMHIAGMGDTEKVAGAVGKVFAEIKKTAGGRGSIPYVKIDPAETSLDPKKIEDILGIKGTLANGVYKITAGRTTNMHDQEVGNAMGVNTWAAFSGSDNKAIVDGDFVMLESEVQAVLKALRRAGINIVALHNHMLMESPRMVFLHFWGIGSTTDLARGIKAALATQEK
jgi:hypothetical protein